MKFTKQDTTAVKGIAITIMMFHHCFMSVNRFSKFDISFYPFSQEFAVSISNFFKICVGMFVFLSAYGLTISLKKYSAETTISGRQYRDYLIPRLIKLMWGFWFVFILSQVISVFIDRPRQVGVYFSHGYIQGILNVFLDFSGLSYLFGTPMLCGTWWYMSLAIFIVLAVPFIAKGLKKYGFLFVTLSVIFLPRIIPLATELEIGENNLCFRWLFAVVLGVLCAQYDILVRMKAFMITKNRYISKAIKFIIATAILVGFVLARTRYGGSYSNYSYEFKDGLIPAFVVYYCYEFIVSIPVVRQILCFLGKHSMNIFLFHTFIRGYWLNEFIYSFHYFWLVALVLLALSVVSSIAIELIKRLIRYDKLMNLIIDKIQGKFLKSQGD